MLVDDELLSRARPRAHIARLNNNGSLDTTFDPGANGPDGTVWTAALQSDGQVVIGRSSTRQRNTSRMTESAAGLRA